MAYDVFFFFFFFVCVCVAINLIPAVLDVTTWSTTSWPVSIPQFNLTYLSSSCLYIPFIFLSYLLSVKSRDFYL